ncbi:MAG: DeoR/GlpR family DNA-binding transcription regulator [Gammaproteobacteria bacterium]|nr:DeoR/GlpR family DNA-binding transcription regulator [Gammaproteobacteria bacterium]
MAAKRSRNPKRLKTRAKLSKSQRQERIVSELKVDAALRVSDLAKRFSVTTETIRRDLDSLAEGGLIARTYGGAASTGSGEPGFNERYRRRVAERRRLAERAATLVEPGDVIMIDAGSTTTHFARRLAANGAKLTVLTNSVGVATALGSNEGIRVVLCPGDYDPHEGGVCGAETQTFLGRFHANKCFIGASGLTDEGPSDANTDAAWVKRVMIERSKRAVLLVDVSKFGVRAADRICALEDLDDIVTDARPDRQLARAISRAKVSLHFAHLSRA